PLRIFHINDQHLFENSINSEGADVNIFENEFNEEFLQINVEAANMEVRNELAIEQFFSIRMLKQNREDMIEEDSVVNPQRSTSSTNEDWSVDDIFFQYNAAL
ncbi:9938_t:CDS:2, partial [Racocetra fulgida]